MTQANQDTDPTALLGTYLLQGWVMTDEICSVGECSVPLMRSKDKSLKFCVAHDTLPTKGPYVTYTKPSATPTPQRSIQPSSTPTASPSAAAPTAADWKQDPGFMDRRQRASELLGQKMLAQWALLNDVCPNDACSAPLVRHPVEKYLHCVVCERDYDLEEGQLRPRPLTAAPQSLAKSHTTAQEDMATSASQTEPPNTRASLHQPPVKLHGDDTSLPTSAELEQLVHSPMTSPATDRRQKRHKTLATAAGSTSVAAASANVVTAIAVSTDRLCQKLLALTEQLETCEDLHDCQLLCQSIEACSNAIAACRKV
ncbi:hypothetical protein DM01DRAFT_1334470 [Hesseltinella vesiculosa]|uniref:Uncharacterized protein n=1 Tax=Hesseltinella vesiculosa TaxID=101127 RepID=A0A1X2GLX0_9FUNG|nr:hypothetical protein DM01DRAFT_1334470 [Hesseltinella vesiculosa]